MGEQACRRTKQFVVGFKAYFYRDNGAARIEFLCDATFWTNEGRRDKKPLPLTFGITLSGAQHPDQMGTSMLKCPPGQAVCGLNTKVQLGQSWGNSDTGINDIQMMCCPY